MLFVIDRLLYAHKSSATEGYEEKPDLTNNRIVLRVLSQPDTTPFFDIHTRLVAWNDAKTTPIPADTPSSFAQRIVSVFEMIWTIRSASDPGRIIGECALHRWNKETREMEFDAALLPEYRRRGFMTPVFSLVIPFVKKKLWRNGIEVHNPRSQRQSHPTY